MCFEKCDKPVKNRGELVDHKKGQTTARNACKRIGCKKDSRKVMKIKRKEAGAAAIIRGNNFHKAGNTPRDNKFHVATTSRKKL